MSHVHTILGDVGAASLGACDAHAQVFIHHSYATQESPNFLLDDERTVTELRAALAPGGRWVVDTMPRGRERDVLKLAEVSRCSGIPIVCPTEMHLAEYYPQGTGANTA